MLWRTQKNEGLNEDIIKFASLVVSVITADDAIPEGRKKESKVYPDKFVLSLI